jgi:hypothetical protein
LRLADCALYDAKKAGKNQAIGMLPTREVSLPFGGAMTVGKEARLTEQLAARTLITLGPKPGAGDPAEKPVTAKGVAAGQQV